MVKYVLCWFPMVLLAILNGTVRVLGYKKYFSELAAHQISTGSLLVLIGIYTYFVIKWLPPSSGKQALGIGIMWSLLTLSFEFGFGMIRGNSLKQLLSAYNFLEGQPWILIPVWVTVAPYIAFRMVSK